VSTVLLLGSTGAVGAGCLDVLGRFDGVSIVIAGRDEARLRSVAAETRADVRAAPLDVANPVDVAAAVAHCDIVVNCAGPSHEFSAPVADAALAAGVPYVDPGGDRALLEKLGAVNRSVPAIVQTGVQPGLSGLLLRALALRRSNKIDEIDAWCGGLQPLTSASVQEYLVSLHSGDGHPGAVLRGGAITRTHDPEWPSAPARYFPGTVSVHPHLDAETVDVADHLGINDLVWFNVLDGSRIKRAMQELASIERHPSGTYDLSEPLAAVKLDLFGRAPYFAIVASARGESVCTTLAFTCRDSYRVTGALTAFAATHIETMPAGTHPFWTIDDPWQVMAFLAEAVPESRVSVIDDSPAADLAGSTCEVEEGSL